MSQGQITDESRPAAGKGLGIRGEPASGILGAGIDAAHIGGILVEMVVGVRPGASLPESLSMEMSFAKAMVVGSIHRWSAACPSQKLKMAAFT